MSSQPASGLRIGSIAGAPIRIGPSWLLLAVAVIAIHGSNLRLGGTPAGTAYGVAAGVALVLLASVLVHEIAHAVTARRAGLRVIAVVADLMGGHTSFDGTRLRPGTSALIAGAGPAANLALGLASWAGSNAVGGGIAGHLLGASALSNLLLAAFNLVPGLPLDGGQILEAGIWGATGDRSRGTTVAAWGGRVVALLVVVVTVLWHLSQGTRPGLSTVWWSLIAWVLWRGASGALLRARVTASLAAHPLSATVHRLDEIRTDTPLSAVDPARLPAFATLDGVPVGLVTAEAIAAVPADLHSTTQVGSVVAHEPTSWVIDAHEDDLLPTVQELADRRLPYAAIRRDGRVIGVLDGRDVQRILDT